LISPPITLPSAGSAVLDFWSRIWLVGYQYGGVWVSTTDNINWGSFTEIKVLSGDEVVIGSWKNISVPLDTYIGETIYLAFLYSNDNGHRWYIDDVTISHFGSFVDMQALSLTPISGNYAILSNNEQITVRLKNNGGQPASGFPIKLFHNDNLIVTETFTGTIPSMGESVYVFNTKLNLSAAGMHKVQVEVNIAGDQVPENNITTSMINNLGCQVNTTFPYVERFENNGDNLPPCWTQEYVAKNFNWRVRDAAGSYGIPGLEPVTAFEGEYKAFFYTNGKDGAITKLIMPPMDITQMSNPALKFHHIQQQYAGDQDSLKIYYKTSPTGNWLFLEKYTKIITEWTERVLPLPEPSNHYYIAFEAYAEYGASVQLDKIIIENYVATDIAVKSITPVGVHLGLSAQQEITATIKNNGRNPVSGFNVKLFLQENLMATEVFAGTIQGLGEANYTFNTTLDLSISGTYALKVVVELTGDEVPENNTLTVFVKNLVCNALTFPYEEDMEEELFPPHCWTEQGGWRRLPYGAHTGVGRASYAWWYGTQGWLISPKLSIPTGEEFVLEFWSHVYEARFYTHSEVMISTTNNNTSSFTLLHELSYSEIPESEWVRILLSLNAYAGKDIFLAFRYRNSGGETGHMWSVDNVKIFNLNDSVSVRENEFENVLVYSYLNVVYIKFVETQYATALQNVEIYDIMGRIIYQTAILHSETVIPLSVAGGVYMVRLISQNGNRMMKKVIITN
jgi:hypothetical protein